MRLTFAGARRWTVFLLASLVIAAGYAGAAPSDKADADKAPRNVLVVNTPAQPVPVTVSNLAATQAVAGTVSVANLPSVQPVSGTVNVASFGIVTTQTAIPAITTGDGAFAFSATGAHDEEVWVNVEVGIAKGQVPMAEISSPAASGPGFDIALSTRLSAAMRRRARTSTSATRPFPSSSQPILG